MSLDLALVERLSAVPDLSAEFSDLLEREGFRLTVPASRLAPAIAGARLIGEALTVRYLPVRREAAALREADPQGKLGNTAALEHTRERSVLVVQSPLEDVSVLGSEAAAMLKRAGAIGAVVDGAVRDLEGLAALPFPTWSTARTPITGRWRLEAVEWNGPVSLCGVQVNAGDVVVADDGGVTFVPADRFAELARRLVQ